jgi:hypothetical protein
MKTNHLLLALCAIFLLALPTRHTLARQPDVSIQILATFDYPGTGNMTLPQKITDRGEIAGYFIDTTGANRGFTRTRSGSFSAPIAEPNDTGNVTQVRGINAVGLLCGYYNDTRQPRIFSLRRHLRGIQLSCRDQHLLARLE